MGSAGYTYDYLSPDDLLVPQAIVNESTLAPDGPAYKALMVLLNQTIILEKTVESIFRLADSGLPLLLVGPAPNQTLFTALLSHNNVQQVADLDSLPSALTNAGILPRVSLHCSSGPVYPVWRSDIGDGSEYVYIYNDQYESAFCQANFTTQFDVVPYIFDAWSGTQRPAAQYNQNGSIVSMLMQLQANETIIIGFTSHGRTGGPLRSGRAISSCSGEIPSLSYNQDEKFYANLHGPARVTCTSGESSFFNIFPPSAINLSLWGLAIEDWHASSDPYRVETALTMHYFHNQPLVAWSSLGPGFDAVSGAGRYNSTFIAPEATRHSELGAVLSLRPVVHTMRAFVNGRRVPPIDPSDPVMDTSSFVQSGSTNSIMVEVTTPLFNHIKVTANSTMVVGQIAGVMQPLYALLPPQEYGLLGPVVIQWAVQQELSC